MTGAALVVGCGYLGRRVAQAWVGGGRKVFALTRSKKLEFEEAGLIPVIGDVTQPDSLASLPTVETLLYAVGWDRGSGRTMHEVYVEGSRNLLTRLPRPGKIIYVSSSSVYSQSDGSWVNEASETNPMEPSGKVVLEAEQMLVALAPEAVILRFTGIYGPGRLLREKAILAGEPLIGDAEKWLNLIHVDDGVRAVVLADTHAPNGSLYNVADNTPCTRREYYTQLAHILHAPTAKFEPGPNVRGDSHRRISNEKIRTELGFTPRYPSYREGLAQAVSLKEVQL